MPSTLGSMRSSTTASNEPLSIADSAAPQPLDDEQIQGAEFLGGLSIPSPAELFAAFGKIGKPDWAALFRKPPPASINSRPLIALHLGPPRADRCLAAVSHGRP